MNTYSHITKLHTEIYGKKDETTEGNSPNMPKQLSEKKPHLASSGNDKKTTARKPPGNQNNPAPPARKQEKLDENSLAL